WSALAEQIQIGTDMRRFLLPQTRKQKSFGRSCGGNVIDKCGRTGASPFPIQWIQRTDGFGKRRAYGFNIFDKLWRLVAETAATFEPHFRIVEP
ncbi:hypothetical protein, partial [Pseudomonas sp. MD195_PC81_125]|uniref:hypothetical protein n=1 Tax=Pseudomonas sp. MD195_PC81_125 TaxID=2741560 RepID=UPI001C7177EF